MHRYSLRTDLNFLCLQDAYGIRRKISQTQSQPDYSQVRAPRENKHDTENTQGGALGQGLFDEGLRKQKGF